MDTRRVGTLETGRTGYVVTGTPRWVVVRKTRSSGRWVGRGRWNGGGTGKTLAVSSAGDTLGRVERSTSG